ncbi:S-methyl-5-thioribose kinase [Kitasatospora sp. NPDC092948]|uniref:S-methyl-5-thioribose kinase n=1 Tax=Kitasatospora sp. NPDC092948 TaxID=3364088 RepID=UPI0037FC73AF
MTATVPLPKGRLLDGRPLADRLAAVPAVVDRLGGGPDDWAVSEIGDGNVNYVHLLHGPAGRLCVKQAMPYVRAVGESWPLTPERAFYEHRALLEHARHSPRVPEVVHYDAELNLLAVEHLAPHTVLRQGLVDGVRYPHLARQLGEHLAATMVGTSDLGLPATRKRPLVALFHGNTEMTGLMEDMVFTEIYHPHPRNSWTSPQLDAVLGRLQADTAVRTAVSRLKLRYLTCTEALLHGDLHTGSVLVTPDDTRVIDQEFACYGPIGFDLGTLLAHLLIAHYAQPGHRPPGPDRDGYQDWLLAAVDELWHEFTRHYLARWERATAGTAYPRVLFPDPAELDAERRRHLGLVLADTLGFCGAEILRRVFGFAHVADFQTIPDPAVRAACELPAVALAVRLLTHPEAFPTVAALTAEVRTTAGRTASGRTADIRTADIRTADIRTADARTTHPN